jgi:hypothetical protein
MRLVAASVGQCKNYGERSNILDEVFFPPTVMESNESNDYLFTKSAFSNLVIFILTVKTQNEVLIPSGFVEIRSDTYINALFRYTTAGNTSF